MEREKQDLLPLLWEYKGRIVGTIFGLLLGLIYLFTDFWRMLVFAVIVVVGYFLGKGLDQPKDTLLELVSRIFPPRNE